MKKLETPLISVLLLSGLLMTCGVDGEKKAANIADSTATEIRGFAARQLVSDSMLIGGHTSKSDSLNHHTIDPKTLPTGGPKETNSSSGEDRKIRSAGLVEKKIVTTVPDTTIDDLGGETTGLSASPVSQSSKVINQRALNKLVDLAKLSINAEMPMASMPPPPEVTAYYNLSFLVYLEDLRQFDYYNKLEAYLLESPNLDSFFINDVNKAIAEIEEDTERAYPQVRPYYFLDGREDYGYENPGYLIVDSPRVQIEKLKNERFEWLTILYAKSLEVLPDARKHKNPVLTEEESKEPYQFFNLDMEPGKEFLQLMYRKTEELIREKRRKVAVTMQIEGGDTFYIANPSIYIDNYHSREDIYEVYPELLSKPLAEGGIKQITYSRDVSQRQAQAYQDKYAELDSILQIAESKLNLQEYAYFDECLSSLNYAAKILTTKAEKLTELLNVSTEEKTYALLPQVIGIMEANAHLLASNPHAKTASTLLWELRDVYYQQVRKAEADFDQKQSER